jgi:uncharacterized membrane protein YuzA (DUF378 family)
MSKIAWILVVIGGLNWGLVGLGMLFGTMGGWNLVSMIFGYGTLAAIVYLLVGIATVATLFGCKCKKCKDAAGNCMGCKVAGDKPMGGAM